MVKGPSRITGMIGGRAEWSDPDPVKSHKVLADGRIIPNKPRVPAVQGGKFVFVNAPAKGPKPAKPIRRR